MKHYCSLRLGRHILLALIILVLTGCAKHGAAGENGGLPQSAYEPTGELSEVQEREKALFYLNSENWFDNRWGVSLVETDSAFVLLPLMGGRLLYCDKASGEFGFLCGKPECVHTGTNCNSYVGSAGNLNYYDGKLYWIGSMQQQSGGILYGLWREDTDGINRVFLADYQDVLRQWGTIETLTLHRGKVYILAREDTVENGIPRVFLRLLAADLDKPADFSVLLERTSSTGFKCELNLVGSYAWLCATSYEETGADMLTWEVLRIDAETHLEERLFYREHFPWTLGDFHVTQDGQAFLSGADNSSPPFVPCQVWRIEKEGLISVITFADETLYYGHVAISENLIRYPALDQEENLTVWYSDLNGNTLYKGNLESSYRKYGEDHGFNTELGGKGNGFFVYMESDVKQKTYLIRYDVTSEGVTEALLISGDRG